jgi:ribosome-associated translation inhibitor RaiA
MKDDKKQIEEEIIKVKTKIAKVLKNVNGIDIRVDKKDKGLYKSLIKIYVPKRKHLLATKEDYDFKRCLEKSQKAIERQLKRTKAAQLRSKMNRYSMDIAA